MKNTTATENNKATGSYRFLAKDLKISEDSRVTGLNNNILVTGISGCGKTGSYVTPNIYSSRGSIVVVDTKGQLYRRHAGELRKRGVKTLLIDFVHPERSAPYNPLDAVRRYKANHTDLVYPGVWEDGEVLLEEETVETEEETFRQQDLIRIASVLEPVSICEKDPFWPQSAQVVLTSLMAYVLEVLPRREQHFGSVLRLFRQMSYEVSQHGFTDVSFFAALEAENPDSFAVRKYRMYAPIFETDKTWACVMQFFSNAMQLFDFDESRKMFNRRGIDLAACGREKTAIFVNVSDTDRSMDTVVNLFYTQLFQALCDEADARPDGRLKVPVHIMLDDFAANVYIPDFDKIVSVIRSRDVSVSIMLQSITQLKAHYNEGQASTIINNCDNMVYMGGQDVDTAKFFADKAGQLPESILGLELDHEWVFTRGRTARLLEKIPPYSMGPREVDSVSADIKIEA